ncbi:hypothetical protein GZ77_12330 [Endozoicomonas montiporae]|uniref:ATPase BadF/BadG/BcrA/BcrD type domain-containing protein n=2 Tax=Endozoicomonas montiporae TaxID=1027273 RepID=A0A081N453_9GAMM|nr:hypothetical protein [Endozoicomonas montiporae]AMO57940.1 NagC/XylR family transcriptional regulator [Endozoicomonas montiporae CL-33]KEQ13226.1 hypothetical protein GZ77_12330 [Endozoicomonas montiporae]
MYFKKLIKLIVPLSLITLFGLISSVWATSPVSDNESDVKSVKGKLMSRWFINKNDNSGKAFCEHHLMIAVEGGGTNTRIRITTPNPVDQSKPYEQVLKQGSNIYRTAEQAIDVTRLLIQEGVEAVASKNHWNSQNTCYELALGMAGTEGNNNDTFLKALQKDPRMQKAVLGSDAETAWLSVFDREGLIVISGTGGITLGRNHKGQVYRKGGFSVPMSDTPSAAAHALHYGNCIHDIVSFENENVFIPAGVHLGFFQKLLSRKQGSGNDVFMYLHGLVTRDLSQFAALAKDIQQYFDGSLMSEALRISPSCEGYKNAGIGSNQGKPDAGSTSMDWSNKDDCANTAMEKSIQDLTKAVSITNPAFQNLPFAIHGTFGKVVWDSAVQYASIHEHIRKRKVEQPIDPLAGALKMLKDIPVQ